MEKGIEGEKNNLYKQTDEVAENVINKLGNINSNIDFSSNLSKENENCFIDYEKITNAITKALTGCKFTIDEDGFAKIVKEELYKVV